MSKEVFVKLWSFLLKGTVAQSTSDADFGLKSGCQV